MLRTGIPKNDGALSIVSVFSWRAATNLQIATVEDDSQQKEVQEKAFLHTGPTNMPGMRLTDLYLLGGGGSVSCKLVFDST